VQQILGTLTFMCADDELCRTLHFRTLLLSAADPWELLEPSTFTSTFVGDTEMYRTSVSKHDGRVWPFFLTKSVYQQLVDFVQEAPGPGPQVGLLVDVEILGNEVSLSLSPLSLSVSVSSHT
jgi:hypothetical protein